MVEYRSGSIRRSYFAHKKNECSYPYGEPESEQHMNGKVCLAEWLSSLFPNSRVELEYKVEITNQRSDVMVLHPFGERWAFEFQCSVIPGLVWEERHQLYQAAGVKDFWILGSHLNDWMMSNLPNYYLRRDLERSIFNSYGYVCYLEDKGENEGGFCFNILRGGTLVTKTILKKTDEFSCHPIDMVSILDDEFWDERMLNYYADPLLINRIRHKPAIYSLVHQRLLEIEKDRNESKEQQRVDREKKNRIKNNEFYKQLLQMRKEQAQLLTENEKELFKKLCIKHGYSFNTLPGIFFTEIKNSHLIKTPPFVWQLWIYDKFIYNKKNAKVWVPSIKEEFKKLRRNGYLRIKSFQYEPRLFNFDNYIFAPGDFIDYLSEIGITKRLSRKNSEYHQIIIDKLQPSKTIQESIFMEWYAMQFAPNQYIVDIPEKVEVEWNKYWKGDY
ncbi:competence protein CoiA [Cytobacillus oceanisediminis]|uniref:competence protein CoiA n=1 Tax=Cytobacillus oceanisediminis TaxID=665099 RepID=UPI0039A63167